jgi:chromosome segregation ATPase
VAILVERRKSVSKYKWDKSKKYVISPNGDECEWGYLDSWLNDLQRDIDKQDKEIEKLQAENSELQRKLDLAFEALESVYELEVLHERLEIAGHALKQIRSEG